MKPNKNLTASIYPVPNIFRKPYSYRVPWHNVRLPLVGHLHQILIVKKPLWRWIQCWGWEKYMKNNNIYLNLGCILNYVFNISTLWFLFVWKINQIFVFLFANVASTTLCNQAKVMLLWGYLHMHMCPSMWVSWESSCENRGTWSWYGMGGWPTYMSGLVSLIFPTVYIGGSFTLPNINIHCQVVDFRQKALI